MICICKYYTTLWPLCQYQLPRSRFSGILNGRIARWIFGGSRETGWVDTVLCLYLNDKGIMRYAILSDIHSDLLALERVLADAKRQATEAFLCLGDVGSDVCLDRLRQVDATLVFGNWEVSQWGCLRQDNQTWVCDLSPMLIGESYLAVHAAPWWPEGLSNVEDFMDYILQKGVKWQVLFPYLDRSEDAFWQAVAELEDAGRHILFHGHTHVQMARRVGPTGHMTKLRGPEFVLDHRAHYIVGVGSVGRPEDGSAPKYVLYDDVAFTVHLRSL
jgi:predicted phosphodiesterase